MIRPRWNNLTREDLKTSLINFCFINARKLSRYRLGKLNRKCLDKDANLN
jgi:hypothetical protein